MINSKFFIASALLLMGACSAADNKVASNEKEQSETTISVKTFNPENRAQNVYGILAHDFDQDGFVDVFPHGHDGTQDVIWFSDGDGTFTPSEIALVSGDRHHCNAGTISPGNEVSLFCAIGAGEGAKKGDSQLYHITRNRQIKPVKGHGAEDPYGRGRDAAFINYNGDEYLDLITRPFGPLREDGKDNFTKLFKQTPQGTFERVSSPIENLFDTSCLEVLDWNKDGYDDVVICNFKRNDTRLFQGGADGFKDISDKISFDKGSAHWRDAKAWGKDLIVMDKAGQIVQFNFSGDEITATPKFTLDKEAAVGNFAVGDVNQDGFWDVYVTRRQSHKVDPKVQNQDRHDYIFLGGPERTRLDVPLFDTPSNEVVFNPQTHQFIVATGGQNWPGYLHAVSVN